MFCSLYCGSQSGKVPPLTIPILCSATLHVLDGRRCCYSSWIVVFVLRRCWLSPLQLRYSAPTEYGWTLLDFWLSLITVFVPRWRCPCCGEASKFLSVAVLIHRRRPFFFLFLCKTLFLPRRWSFELLRFFARRWCCSDFEFGSRSFRVLFLLALSISLQWSSVPTVDSLIVDSHPILRLHAAGRRDLSCSQVEAATSLVLDQRLFLYGGWGFWSAEPRRAAVSWQCVCRATDWHYLNGHHKLYNLIGDGLLCPYYYWM